MRQCSCCTKSPDIKYHKPDCAYRIDMEEYHAEHKFDVFGNELFVGDTVAFTAPGYTYELKTGKIVALTPKKIKIEWGPRQRQTYKFPEQVVKKVN